jgi:hypothetical protein
VTPLNIRVWAADAVVQCFQLPPALGSWNLEGENEGGDDAARTSGGSDAWELGLER